MQLNINVDSHKEAKRLQKIIHITYSLPQFDNRKSHSIKINSEMQTVFVNNPFLGMLIMAGIFIGHVEAGIGCAVGW